MGMSFRPADAGSAVNYRTLVGAVVPRPIGWISTVGADGVDNVAPFSFFGVACVDPPMLQFSQGTRADGTMKDTGRNVHETGEFVHNVVTESTLEAMHESSATLGPGESEFDACGIERAPARTVSPPRVADAVASFECRLHRALELGTHTLFVGRVEYVHVDESATTDGSLDIDAFDPVGRLTAGRYVGVDSQCRMEPVKGEDFPKDGE